MGSLRDRILNTEDVETREVFVPEWGETLAVRGLTLAEQRHFLTKVTRQGEVDRDRFAPQLIISTVRDPQSGDPVFEYADAEALTRKSARAVSRLLNVAVELSGLGGDEQVEAVVDDLKGTADSDSASG